MKQSCFHLAFNVRDLQEARTFYCDILGCEQGRMAETWIDINFFGHQLSLHVGEPFKTQRTGKVGDHMVPMPHLGAILPLEDWKILAQNLQAAKIDFVFPPFARFVGEPGEQHTMFFCDPSGNPIEIKGFADMSGLFAS
ncbi:MAG: VOC family protein [Cohaesibacter sp.]|nr:VOC family protein [Cohaesibacter sp.]